jgi:Domain of unknown function (DUF397)
MRTFPEFPIWRVSSWSAGGNCIEVANRKNVIYVRDTKNRSQGMLSFTAAAWENFIRALQAESITFK